MTPLENWGKDHWSLFAYVETRVTDYKGTLDHNHLRPREYPTRLKDGEEVQDQGDLDLLRDLEDLGLTKNEGSGLNPLLSLTEKGWEWALSLRKHKSDGNNFRDFQPPL